MSKKQNPGIVLVDVDGVCADFIAPILEVVNAQRIEVVNGAGLVLVEREHVTSWGLEHIPGFTPELYDLMNSRGFARSLHVIDGAQEAIAHIRERGHRVVFCTTPNRDSPTWAYERAEWLAEHFGADYRDIVQCHDKSLVVGDVLVDDKPDNLRHVHDVLFTQPWNRDHTHERRMAGWHELHVLEGHL